MVSVFSSGASPAGAPPGLPRARQARASARLHSGLVWGAVGVLVLAALAWLLRDLMVLPRLTDETREVWLGLQIARGDVLPLTGVQPYIGALYSYLVAGAFVLLGPRIDVGRIVVAEAGALTIIPTFLLGRALGGPGWRGQAVGLIAATLLAASATHTLVTSRIAYSNSLTPLFTTTGLWLLQRALARQSGPSLVGSGLAFGLALQTHVASLALGPGLLAGLLLGGRALLFERAGERSPDGHNGRPVADRRGPLPWPASRWLPGRWAVLAGLAGLAAVANLVAFNLVSGLGSVAGAGLRTGATWTTRGGRRTPGPCGCSPCCGPSPSPWAAR